MKRFKSVLLLLVVVATLSVSCGEKFKPKTEITLIATNDIHAKVENFPKLAYLVDKMKDEGRNVVLVDCGDHFSGSPFVDYAAERGEPMIRLMNALDYDLGTLGNHEFDYGQKILKERLEQAEFETICANINSDKSVVGQFKPTYSMEIDGITLQFVGFIQIEEKSRIPSTNIKHLDSITFDYFGDIVSRYKHLEDEGEAFIAVSHLGIVDDSLLAKAMPELDVILGGHSHTHIDKTNIYNDVMITQTDSDLKYASMVTLTFEYGKLVKREHKLITLNTIEGEDEEVKEIVKDILNNEEFNKVIGSASQSLNEHEYVANFACDAITYTTNCDFAFYNRGGIRQDSISKGDITLAKVLSIDPFENTVYHYNMTLNDMKELIKRHYHGVQGLNLYMSEGKYEVKEVKGDVVVDIYGKDGKLLTDSGKIYKVGLTNYLDTIDDKLPEPTDSGVPITTTMVEYLKAKGPISHNQKRAFIVR